MRGATWITGRARKGRHRERLRVPLSQRALRADSCKRARRFTRDAAARAYHKLVRFEEAAKESREKRLID